MNKNNKSRNIVIILFIIIVIGLPFYVVLHDKMGLEAYVRIESKTIPIPMAPITAHNIVINDFTYFDRTILDKVNISIDGKEYKRTAFMADELPREKGDLKQAHFIVVMLSGGEIKQLKSAKKVYLTYYYKDGTKITKPIQL